MKYALYSTLIAKPDERDNLKGLLLQVAEAFQKNKDCLQYIVGTTDDPDAVWIAEVWATKDTHRDSLKPANIHAIVQQVLPLIADAPEAITAYPEGGKGL